ncbi:MAG: ABC transporter substrate-binding protein [Rickettsiales bacterium]|jgi:glutamine transport system substrate-binding protein|nr:ABC transporter substrate-binding protein [Rickettsiales bacterium]
MNKFFLIFGSLLLSGLCFAKTLRVGINPKLAPFVFKYDKDIVGFEVDIINAIAEQLKYDVEFVETSNVDLIPNLNKNKFDVVCSAFVITKNREKLVLFTDSHFSENLSIVVKRNSIIRRLRDLNNKRIGITVEGVAFNYIKNHTKNSHLFAVNSEKTLYNLLFSNKVDAVVESSLSVKYFVLSNQSKMENKFDVVELEIDEMMQMAFAVKKNNEELKNILDEELKKIKKNGIYKSIYDKWFF